jgi:hypothetical protein
LTGLHVPISKSLNGAMAKKGKKAKAAAAATASQTAFTTASDLDFQLSHNTDPSDEFSSQLNRILEEKSTSFSLPSSPVIKVTHSIQPSPALSASVTQAIDEDFKPISLPPLNISEILEPGPPPDIDWSLFDTQPLRGKKRAKPKQAIARLRSPLREDTSHEELVSTCRYDHNLANLSRPRPSHRPYRKNCLK